VWRPPRADADGYAADWRPPARERAGIDEARSEPREPGKKAPDGGEIPVLRANIGEPSVEIGAVVFETGPVETPEVAVLSEPREKRAAALPVCFAPGRRWRRGQEERGA
jgi:hypothetical protein